MRVAATSASILRGCASKRSSRATCALPLVQEQPSQNLREPHSVGSLVSSQKVDPQPRRAELVQQDLTVSRSLLIVSNHCVILLPTIVADEVYGRNDNSHASSNLLEIAARCFKTGNDLLGWRRDDDRQILGEVMTADNNFHSAVQAIAERSACHRNAAQPVLAAAQVRRGQETTPAEVEAMLGHALHQETSEATETMIQIVDRTIVSTQRIAEQLREALLRQCPGRTFIRFFPK